MIQSYKIDSLKMDIKNLSKKTLDFTIKRIAEIMGLILILISILLFFLIPSLTLNPITENLIYFIKLIIDIPIIGWIVAGIGGISGITFIPYSLFMIWFSFIISKDNNSSKIKKSKIEVDSEIKEEINEIEPQIEIEPKSFTDDELVEQEETPEMKRERLKRNTDFKLSKIKNIDEKLRDHALFTAFAPINNPQIAIAVIVENAGSGSSKAAPLARELLDEYFIINPIETKKINEVDY